MPVLTTKAKAQWVAAIKVAKDKKRPKFGNVRCQDKDGRPFDSKRERENHLALERMYGKRDVMRQISFVIVDGPKKVRLIVDHVVLNPRRGADRPEISLYDTKGKAPTRDWINKARMLQEKHGLRIIAIGKGLKEIGY